MDDTCVQGSGRPFMLTLEREILVEPAGKGEHEGHDVRGDVLIENAAKVGDGDWMSYQLRRVVPSRRRNGGRLEPLQPVRRLHQLRRQSSKSSISVGDLSSSIIPRLRHNP